MSVLVSKIDETPSGASIGTDYSDTDEDGGSITRGSVKISTKGKFVGGGVDPKFEWEAAKKPIRTKAEHKSKAASIMEQAKSMKAKVIKLNVSGGSPQSWNITPTNQQGRKIAGSVIGNKHDAKAMYDIIAKSGKFTVEVREALYY